jgi:3-hydroxyacyl-CoA dehydrogenase/enoyl-CoA hydratase/3-hydroxybutyryl-CoA epimerase
MSSDSLDAIWRWEAHADGTRILWFDQPGRSQNVLDSAALEELEARLVEVDGDGSARAVVIRSAKAAGFCAGIDLTTALAFQSAAAAEAFARRGLTVFEHLAALQPPTVAVVHGACLGGGLELALACRRRVALASAAPLQMAMPEVHYGLIPCWGAISRLPRLVGPDEGLDLLITGRSIGYLLARSLGIVDRLAAEGDSIESLDVFSPSPVPLRTWPQETWEEAWNRAREKIDEEPGDHPEAQLQILTIAAIDHAHGYDAAVEATVAALAESALSDVVRESIAAYVNPVD